MSICQLGMHNSVQDDTNANVCKQTYDACCTPGRSSVTATCAFLKGANLLRTAHRRPSRDWQPSQYTQTQRCQAEQQIDRRVQEGLQPCRGVYTRLKLSRSCRNGKKGTIALWTLPQTADPLSFSHLMQFANRIQFNVQLVSILC